MALSSVTYTAAPAQETFSVTFDYLQQSYVKVYVDGVEDTTFTWPTASTITLTSAASGGETVLIERTTPYTPVVTFSSVSTVTKDNLNNIITQVIHIAQEVVDDLSNSIQLANDDKWDADSKEIKGLADAQNSDEAVNKSQLDAAVIAAGNVPTPADPGDDGSVLQASGGTWSWVSSLATSILNVSANVKSILDAADFSTVRTLLGLGTVYQYDVGTSANNIVQLDGSAKLPSVDGSALTAVISRATSPGNVNAGADTDHDMTLAASNFLSDQGTVMSYASDLTKQIDAAWSAGDNAGGMDTGTVAADTWYSLWAIKNSSTGDCDMVYSLQATGGPASPPAGYDEYRRVRWVLTDGSANIIASVQDGDFVYWDVPVSEANSTSFGTTNAILVTLTAPPNTLAKIGLSSYHASSAVSVLATTPGVQADTAPGATAFTVRSSGGASEYVVLPQGIDSSSQMRLRADNGTTTYSLMVFSYMDRRGRDDTQ